MGNILKLWPNVDTIYCSEQTGMLKAKEILKINFTNKVRKTNPSDIKRTKEGNTLTVSDQRKQYQGEPSLYNGVKAGVL